MEQYTIYCTEEQTRRALELGAPILHSGFNEGTFDYCIGINGKVYVKPTAEQMLGWLREEKGVVVEITAPNIHGTTKVINNFIVTMPRQIVTFSLCEYDYKLGILYTICRILDVLEDEQQTIKVFKEFDARQQ